MSSLTFFSYSLSFLFSGLCENSIERPSGHIQISLRSSGGLKKKMKITFQFSFFGEHKVAFQKNVFNRLLRLLQRKDNSSFILRLVHSRAVREQRQEEGWQLTVCLFFVAACNFRDKVFVYRRGMTNETGRKMRGEGRVQFPGTASFSSTSPRLFLLVSLSSESLQGAAN